jgi:6-phosphofructokinase 2
MKIVTLTVNPSIDKSTTVKDLIPEQKLRCDKPLFQPGGGGINVSRAINKIGGDSLAIYLAGGGTGELLTKLIAEEGVKCKVIQQADRTRENFIVVDDRNQQFRFGMPGTTVTATEIEEVVHVLDNLEELPEFLVLSGSLQDTVPSDFYARIAVEAKEKGVKVILDTVEKPFEEALKVGVYMIKPNLQELFEMAGYDDIVPGKYPEIARQMIADGKTEIMVISKGSQGASMVTKDAHYTVVPPATPCRSTVGAGDSMVGGIVLGLSKGLGFEKALQLGVATGTAATMNQGTSLCKKEDVDQITAYFESEEFTNN